MQKRKLTQVEIKSICKQINHFKYTPSPIRTSILNKLRRGLTQQLKKVEVYPSIVPELIKAVKKEFFATIACPGEAVGVVMAQSIGERQTQIDSQFLSQGWIDICNCCNGCSQVFRTSKCHEESKITHVSHKIQGQV